MTRRARKAPARSKRGARPARRSGALSQPPAHGTPPRGRRRSGLVPSGPLPSTAVPPSSAPLPAHAHRGAPCGASPPVTAAILPAQHRPLPPGATPAAAILIQSPSVVRAGGAGTAPALRRCGARTTCPQGAGRGRRWGPARKGGPGRAVSEGARRSLVAGGPLPALWCLPLSQLGRGRSAERRRRVAALVRKGSWRRGRGARGEATEASLCEPSRFPVRPRWPRPATSKTEGGQGAAGPPERGASLVS